MKEQIHKSTSRKATAEQSISFYERQKNFLSKAESKIAIMRAEKTKNENPDYSGIPSINKTSKSLKRSFNDLLTWKTTVNAKVVKRREQKEKEELLSLKTYKSSTSGCHIKRCNSQLGIKQKIDFKPIISPKAAIWPLKFEKPNSTMCQSQLSFICQSNEASQHFLDNNELTFF